MTDVSSRNRQDEHHVFVQEYMFSSNVQYHGIENGFCGLTIHQATNQINERGIDDSKYTLKCEDEECVRLVSVCNPTERQTCQQHETSVYISVVSRHECSLVILALPSFGFFFCI